MDGRDLAGWHFAVSSRSGWRTASTSRMMLLSLSAIVLGACWIGISAANAQSSPGLKRVIPVQAAVVERGDLKVYLSSLGTVTALNSVTVRARVDGPLTRLSIREGELAKAGQLLAEIDPRPFQVQLTQAEGQLARDQAQLESARQDLARYQVLLAQDSISRQQVDNQEALVRQYAGVIKIDQAGVDSAKLQLSYSRIVAPVTGRLGLRLVDVGNMVRASDSNGIVTINQVDPINVVFTLPEAQLAAVLQPLRSGRKMIVEAWDREQKNLLRTGVLSSIDNQIELTTGTVKLKAAFDNKDGALFPNQFVNIRLLAETRSNGVVAPQAAIQQGRAGAFVYVVGANSSVTQRQVKLGPVNAQKVLVLEGLQPGERVVTDGIDQLRDGAKVELVDPRELLKEKSASRRGGKGKAVRPQASAPKAAD